MRLIAGLALTTIFLIAVAAAVIAVLNTPAIDTPPEAETTIRSSPARSATDGLPQPTSVTRRDPDLPTPQRQRARTDGARDLETLLSEPGGVQFRQLLGNGTPIYLSNSSGSRVLASVQADDPVEAGVRVFNEDGLWIEVRLNQETYGFVRGDDLLVN